MAAVADEFSGRIIRLHGSFGEDWLASLPRLTEHYAQRWSLQTKPPQSALTYNYIVPASGPDGAPLILKLGLPNPELTSEIESLKIFNGRAAVRLINSDPAGGALLLERALPGEALIEHTDDLEASRIACAVMTRLWKPVPQGCTLPTIADWARGFERLKDWLGGETGPFPPGMVDQAEGVYFDLLRSMDEPVVLHGDLHHWNILSSARDGWLAIDPKGLVGEREYEIGAWMRNPFPGLLSWSRPVQRLQQRLDLISDELDLDRTRLKRWSFAQAVLSAWWSIEDREPHWDQSIAVASLLMVVR